MQDWTRVSGGLALRPWPELCPCLLQRSPGPLRLSPEAAALSPQGPRVLSVSFPSVCWVHQIPPFTLWLPRHQVLFIARITMATFQPASQLRCLLGLKVSVRCGGSHLYSQHLEG